MNQPVYVQPHSYANGDQSAPVYPIQVSSGPPEHQFDFLDPADVWRDFQVYRSSAEYHLNNYLDHLAQSCQLPNDTPSASKELSTGTQPARSRIQLQIKISRDTAIRDLLAMENILAYANYARSLRKTKKPTYSRLTLLTAIWTIACSLSAVIISAWGAADNLACGPVAGAVAEAVTGTVVFSMPPAWHWYQDHRLRAVRARKQELRRSDYALKAVAGAVSGAVALAAPPAWDRYQDHQLNVTRDRVQELRRNFQSNIGAVSESSRNVLKDSQYEFLRHMFDD